jgi:hypothetical protein
MARGSRAQLERFCAGACGSRHQRGRGGEDRRLPSGHVVCGQCQEAGAAERRQGAGGGVVSTEEAVVVEASDSEGMKPPLLITPTLVSASSA